MESKMYLNRGQDDQMEIVGYKKNRLKTAVTWLGIVLTVGLLRLFFYWLPHLMVRATHTQCELSEAQVVVLRDQYEQRFVSKVQTVTKDGTFVKVVQTPSVMYSQAKESVQPLKEDAMQRNTSLVRFFVTKKVKYTWQREKQEFCQVKGLEEDVPCSYFHHSHGLSLEEQYQRRVMYGINSIRIHVTPIIVLLFKEVLSPFYIFQVFSCCLWYSDHYEYYASCIVAISVISITVTVYQIRKMQRALRSTVDSSTLVTVCRAGNVFEEIPSEDLVPGDVIEIPRTGCVMQCDAVLVTGNCIVNESMLTGESVPVTKTSLPNPKSARDDEENYFNIKEHARHVLFCGTHVIQTRFYGGRKVLAVVFRTGFSTSKGELVRSILYPKPVDFRFNKDTYKFIGVLAFIAFCGLVYTLVIKIQRGAEAAVVIQRSLDLITIAVPPALPAALTVGIVFAQARMKQRQIYCISPRNINVCGSINTVCFDKTGTLTEDGLDMQSILPVDKGSFQTEIHEMAKIPDGCFKVGMASCHSLTLIDGQLSGDPLELIMFDAIGWELNEPGEEETSRFDMFVPTIVKPNTQISSYYGPSSNSQKPLEVGIVRQFTFSSSLQRMSVIVRKLGASNFEIFSKGAPEMIASLCIQESVPGNFQEILGGFTQHGYRVLALAYRDLPEKLKYTRTQRIQRAQVERNLTFLGLLVMENRLKPETTPIIDELRTANIRTIMVTGDNMLTALSVARECGMVDELDPIILVQAYPPQTDKPGTISVDPQVEYVLAENNNIQTPWNTGKSVDERAKIMPVPDYRSNYQFAVTGKSWAVLRQYFPEVLQKVVLRGAVFGRMSPDQKAQLVEVLQDLGYYVGMCGDGANDCGALKTAHAGISLSEAEASVASPFTSKTPNISCVPAVISEGRAALVTSFGIFKYMACYSLTQFVSVLLLYWVGVNLTDFEFLYVDFALLTTLSITFGRTKPYHQLVKDPPPVSLVSLAPVLSLFLQMVIMAGFQVFYLFYVQTEEWFVPWVDDPSEARDYKSYENTAVFNCSMYQYIILAVVFSKGRPYRKSMFSNFWFVANLAFCVALSMWITIYPVEGLAKFMELQPSPSIPFRLMFVGTGVINLLICLLLEMFVIESRLVTVSIQNAIDNCLPGGKPQHYHLEKEMVSSPGWPPVKQDPDGLAGQFQKMDNAFQSMNDQVADDTSLLDSGSETQSLHSIDTTDRTELVECKDDGIRSQCFPVHQSPEIVDISFSSRHSNEGSGFASSDSYHSLEPSVTKL